MDARPPRIGSRLTNKLSGRMATITGMVRTKKGRAWTVALDSGATMQVTLDQVAVKWVVVG